LKKQAEVVQGDLYENLKFVNNKQKEVLRKFDVIVCNPPYSAGKEVVNKIIEQAPNYLSANGNLQIVGRKSKGGEMYKQKMIEVFGNCEEFGIESGFRIYMSKV
jgi:16S rRNA G1207 methylase RsmC